MDKRNNSVAKATGRLVFLLLAAAIVCWVSLFTELEKTMREKADFSKEIIKESRIIESANTGAAEQIEIEDPMESVKIEMALIQQAEDFRNGGDKDALTQAMGYDYDYVVQVVMAEMGGESEELQRAVCQCIRNACRASGDKLSPYDVVLDGYTTPEKPATDQVWHVCNSMFILCDTYTPVEDAVYFYNADVCTSSWHESKEYVTSLYTHKGEEIRFFREAG